MELERILADFKAERLSLEQAKAILSKLPYESLDFAKLDHHRQQRKGHPETIFCPGKTAEQLTALAQRFQAAGSNILGTRATPEQAEAVREQIPEIEYDPQSRLLRLELTPLPRRGLVAVCTGGTADIPVAEEAAGTAEFLGCQVLRCYDVGVAGIHRLFAHLPELRKANVLLAIAGMEGALGSVLSGLVSRPVIAVPTSVGYGASFQGLAPLLTMLNSCAEGMAVVNIDNGFGAGYMAAQINALATDKQNINL